MSKTIHQAHHYPEIGVPYFWPFGLAVGLEEAGLQMAVQSLNFATEIETSQIARDPPGWASPNKVLLDLHTVRVRAFSDAPGTAGPVLVLPPYAGHTSTIADFHEGQSLIATLRDNGCPSVFATDWRSATQRMRFYDIDDYLAEINIVVDELGGEIALVGLCQGGWCAAMYAARYPHKVRRLVLAGSPIDTDAGEGPIRTSAHLLPMRFYEELVTIGGGLLKGSFMLEGFKNMHPVQQYVSKFAELYEHVDDPSYVKRFERFERWYEYTVDLPGSWYLQVIQQLFKENRLANGTFVGLGRRLNLAAITCPTYLLAGASDDITPQEQVFAAERLFGTPSADIKKDVAEGGHIGLFMSHSVLQRNWINISRWLAG